jgi:hypothetical protein
MLGEMTEDSRSASVVPPGELKLKSRNFIIVPKGSWKNDLKYLPSVFFYRHLTFFWGQNIF